MSGINILADTNIIIYLLAGDQGLLKILEDKKISISVITEIEVLSYPNLTREKELLVRELLSRIFIIPLTESVKEGSISIKKKYKVKLPDAIIAASAIQQNIPLLTADSDFEQIEELDLISYDLS